MISVIMPVYNNATYLRESIDSILAQTYDDFEFIILDDVSTEPVWDIINSYDDERIIALRNYSNIGLTKSLNICLDKARGSIIARQDSDDISHPNRFEEEVPLIQGGVGLVSCYANMFNQNGIFQDPWLNKEVKFSDEKIKSYIKKGNCIVGPAAMYPRKVVDTIGYYDEDVYLAQDYNYWIRILAQFDVKICRKALYNLRSHSNSVRTIRSKTDKTDWVKVCQQRAKQFPVIKEKKQMPSPWHFSKDKQKVIIDDYDLYVNAQDNIASEEDDLRHIKRNKEVLDKMLEFKSIHTVVDLGCREGLVSDLAKSNNIQYLGIDISPKSVQFAQSKGRNVIEGDAQNFKHLTPDSVDGVISVHSLEHCYDPEECLQQCYDTLEPQGLLGLRIPIQTDITAQPLLKDKCEHSDDGLPAHFCVFSPESILKMLRGIGFTKLHSHSIQHGTIYEEFMIICQKP